MAKVDIDQLFMAGIIPGFLLIVILSLWSIKNGRMSSSERKKFSGSELLAAFKESFWEVLLPIGVLVGIYGGFTTPSEAAAMTAFYILIIECFVYKDLSIMKDIPRVILDSMSLVGAILLILCCALGRRRSARKDGFGH